MKMKTRAKLFLILILMIKLFCQTSHVCASDTPLSISVETDYDGLVFRSSVGSFGLYDSYTYVGAASYVDGDKYRGFFRFNISDIPDGATVSKIIFKYHGQSRIFDCILVNMTVDPSTVEKETIFWDIGNATTLYSVTPFPLVGTEKEAVLGENSDSTCQQFENILSSECDWYAVGFMKSNEATTQDAMSKIYSEEYGSVDPEPTLYVEYYLNPKSYTFTGLYYENGSRAGDVSVTASMATGTDIFTVNGTTTQHYADRPIIFSYSISGGGTRRLYVGLDTENFTITTPDDTYSVYSFTVRDYTGQVGRSNSYLESLRMVNGTDHMIERILIQDSANTIPLILVQTQIYTLRVRFMDDTLYNFGIFIPGVETLPTLSIYGLDSSEQLHYIGENVTATFQRPTYGTIKTNYTDIGERTTSIFVEICNLNGTQVWNDTSASHSHVFTWNGATAATDYLVNLVAQHPEYEEIYASCWLSGLKPEFEATPDFDEMLGEGASTGFALFLIFAAFFLFSRATVLLGIFFATSMTYIMIYNGFLDMPYLPVHVTMALTVMYGLSGGSKR